MPLLYCKNEDRPASAAYLDHWAEMRAALWPELSVESHRSDIAKLILGSSPPCVAFIALSEANASIGFAEASLRHDFVNGCETSPVLFLEGIYVQLAARGKGIGTSLCEAVASWGRSAGCSEFASDAYVDDAASHAFHRALGFQEAERVVYFRKLL
jgi:aminoglycoside 6'-N-acetyltransferase I